MKEILTIKSDLCHKKDIKAVKNHKYILRIVGKCLPKQFLKCYTGAFFIEPGVEEIRDEALQRTNIKFFDFSKTSIIQQRAFAGSTIAVADFSNSPLQELGKGAFWNCEELETLVLSPHCYQIPTQAFDKAGLKHIDTSLLDPEKIYTFNSYCFHGNENLKEVSFRGKLVALGGFCFQACTNLHTITLSGAVTRDPPHNADARIPLGAFAQCFSLEQVNGLESYYSIGEIAFRECKNLKTVENLSALQYIDDQAFFQSGLQAIHLPDTLIHIGNSAFKACVDLKEVRFATREATMSPLEIQEFAFQDCISLEEISIPEGVTAIKDECFSGCRKLKKVILPHSLKHLGRNAFANCHPDLVVEINPSEEVLIGLSNAFTDYDEYLTKCTEEKLIFHSTL